MLSHTTSHTQAHVCANTLQHKHISHEVGCGYDYTPRSNSDPMVASVMPLPIGTMPNGRAGHRLDVGPGTPRRRMSRNGTNRLREVARPTITHPAAAANDNAVTFCVWCGGELDCGCQPAPDVCFGCYYDIPAPVLPRALSAPVTRSAPSIASAPLVHSVPLSQSDPFPASASLVDFNRPSGVPPIPTPLKRTSGLPCANAPVRVSDPKRPSAPPRPSDPAMNSVPSRGSDPVRRSEPTSRSDPTRKSVPVTASDPEPCSAPTCNSAPTVCSVPLPTSNPATDSVPASASDPCVTSAPFCLSDPIATSGAP